MDTGRLERILKDGQCLKAIRSCLGYELVRKGFIASIGPDGTVKVGDIVDLDESQHAQKKEAFGPYLHQSAKGWPQEVVDFYYTLKSEAFEKRFQGYVHRHGADLDSSFSILDSEWYTDPASEAIVRGVLGSGGADPQSSEVDLALIPGPSQLVSLNEAKLFFPGIPFISLQADHYPNRSENIGLLAAFSNFPYAKPRGILDFGQRVVENTLLDHKAWSIPGHFELSRGVLDLDRELVSFD